MANNYILQKSAADFRTSKGIGACEPIRLKSWLPKLGIVAVFRPLSEHFSGMALKQDEQRFMVINSNHRLSKQHFTIAHELYHLFIQTEFSSEISNAGQFDKKDKVEYEADCFAAYLLLPENCLLSQIPSSELGKNKISLSTLVQIEQYFACSRRALLFRLNSMDLIDVKHYEAYAKGVQRSAELLGYDTSLYQPGNKGLVIGDYGVRAKNLLDKQLISETHFLSLMSDIGKDLENLPKDNEPEE
jgi:Zn-dependent peptidase ImmA (M78 family)